MLDINLQDLRRGQKADAMVDFVTKDSELYKLGVRNNDIITVLKVTARDQVAVVGYKGIAVSTNSNTEHLILERVYG